MARKKIRRSKKWDCLKEMPPLYHKLPDQPFDLEDSQVLEWIAEQSEILEWIRSTASSNELIVYDSVSGKWQGVDFEEGLYD